MIIPPHITDFLLTIHCFFWCFPMSAIIVVDDAIHSGRWTLSEYPPLESVGVAKLLLAKGQ